MFAHTHHAVTTRSSMSSTTTTTSSSVPPLSACFVTVPNVDVGKQIARHLVEHKLAACVNILPGVTSIYSWQGKVEEDSELLLMIKTRTELIGELTSAVKSLHPYQVVEVISTQLGPGNPPYLDWLLQNTAPPPAATNED